MKLDSGATQAALAALARPSRRGLLATAAAAVASRAVRAAPAGPAVDTDGVLGAAAERILPSDDGPGAREAHVREFLRRQSSGELSALRPALESAALLLDSWARRSAGAGFVTLAPEAQDRILAQLAHGQIPVRSFPQTEVFRSLHSLVLEGFLSDPIYGGNAGEVGWRSLGVRAPSLRPHGHVHGR